MLCCSLALNVLERTALVSFCIIAAAAATNYLHQSSLFNQFQLKFIVSFLEKATTKLLTYIHYKYMNTYSAYILSALLDRLFSLSLSHSLSQIQRFLVVVISMTMMMTKNKIKKKTSIIHHHHHDQHFHSSFRCRLQYLIRHYYFTATSTCTSTCATYNYERPTAICGHLSPTPPPTMCEFHASTTSCCYTPPPKKTTCFVPWTRTTTSVKFLSLLLAFPIESPVL